MTILIRYYSMRIFLVFCLFSGLNTIAQDSIRYDTLISSSEGRYYKMKYRSPVTGQKQFISMKTGVWKYFDAEGNILKIEEYSVDRSGKTNRKHGLELYLHPQTGDTLLARMYSRSGMDAQHAYHEAILVEKSRIIHIYLDFDSYTIVESSRTKNPTVDFVTLWKSSMEDPGDVLTTKSYLAFEDSLGDPSLLEDAVYGTKSRYNYVANPEFEDHPNAKFSIISFNDQVSHWLPASESPDFYLSPGHAHSGNSFIGFRVFTMVKHIEYVQNRLREPLKKDSVYCFSAYIKLSPGSKYASNSFGVMFANDKQHVPVDELHRVQADIQLSNQLLSYKTRWMKVQCTYKARGGERYMVIGSFKDHRTLELVEVPGTIGETYYYLDDVSLVPVKTPKDCPCNFTDSRAEKPVPDTTLSDETQLDLEHLKPGDRLVLDDIHFDNDEAELLPASFPVLIQVLEYLLSKPGAEVEISGHTSNTGDEEHNLKLSERRAEAVKNFLINNGVQEARIITKGYGPEFPIADNDTEEGRALNRRVELKLLKN